MSYITPDNFVGKFTIAQGFKDEGSKIQEYIDYYQNYYLVKLLGADLYVLFQEGVIAGDEIYTKLYDAFNFDSDVYANKAFTSEGVELMLTCFVYAHYRKQDLGVATTGGQVKLVPEGGKLAEDDYADYFSIYNQGVKTYKTIRQWILENLSDYPDFNGVPKGLAWLV